MDWSSNKVLKWYVQDTQPQLPCTFIPTFVAPATTIACLWLQVNCYACCRNKYYLLVVILPVYYTPQRFTDFKKLEAIFSTVCKIKSCTIAIDKNINKPKGFAFVITMTSADGDK